MIALAEHLQKQVEAERFLRFVAQHNCSVYAHPETIDVLPALIRDKLDVMHNEFVERGALMAVNRAAFEFDWKQPIRFHSGRV